MAASTRPWVTRPPGTSARYAPRVTDLQRWLTDRVRESPMNQREIAQAVGITEKHMSQLMQGHAMGSLRLWQDILDVIGVRLPEPS
jgi:DNA-binding XRE family transcriptional regulator